MAEKNEHDGDHNNNEYTNREKKRKESAAPKPQVTAEKICEAASWQPVPGLEDHREAGEALEKIRYNLAKAMLEHKGRPSPASVAANAEILSQYETFMETPGIKERVIGHARHDRKSKAREAGQSAKPLSNKDILQEQAVSAFSADYAVADSTISTLSRSQRNR